MPNQQDECFIDVFLSVLCEHFGAFRTGSKMDRDCENTQVKQSTRARNELSMKTSALKTICANAMFMMYSNLLSNKRALAHKNTD